MAAAQNRPRQGRSVLLDRVTLHACDDMLKYLGYPTQKLLHAAA